jgi:hypothetical protein
MYKWTIFSSPTLYSVSITVCVSWLSALSQPITLDVFKKDWILSVLYNPPIDNTVLPLFVYPKPQMQNKRSIWPRLFSKSVLNPQERGWLFDVIIRRYLPQTSAYALEDFDTPILHTTSHKEATVRTSEGKGSYMPETGGYRANVAELSANVDERVALCGSGV